jgi:prepilin-type processing-associated H-X9-DG protein
MPSATTTSAASSRSPSPAVRTSRTGTSSNAPATPTRAGSTSSARSATRAQLLAVQMPGAYSGMRNVVNAMRNVFPLSYAGNYFLSRTYDPGFDRNNYRGGEDAPAGRHQLPCQHLLRRRCGQQHRAQRQRLRRVVHRARLRQQSQATPAGAKGRRHQEGRNWTFCDGHAKFYNDPAFEVNGVPRSQLEITYEYQARGIYTFPETTGPDYRR